MPTYKNKLVSLQAILINTLGSPKDQSQPASPHRMRRINYPRPLILLSGRALWHGRQIKKTSDPGPFHRTTTFLMPIVALILNPSRWMSLSQHPRLTAVPM
ncbi:hypothetical protein S40285_10467 [Stachybotrys chlorohalonatus IBT 40285]|uniref:Uncharacterized protein n=1 Tax=Stachybotrys chlorohalonatus (strain IBT 40285) TaxID=1283841 RepID=A0A084QX69_STAC4|nr:hypothetical protein S40285_10467 [Stachybotrys chlorohalonata IBT 40285]